ncbi:MAG: peptide chain release factor N(5)-glutamine methyltransferase [Hoeflea sp.]|nr:peptide chain release factor N(5)-glutamine methyltransferase [Alphaproteobacteria bacterium]MBV1726300.1 peptide chain release factor N(5)-glutamine methyltransferase [Hoeflea sp.]MBU4545498.1 peptide chain release factor N(5)-glutamine methyltransferase [Alphaproteobacteria bacterium]MBU4552108.1 peptide chain release factor N(5)-glutamine methyltransferase [Alphaproteobacteria bacterium]MBV1762273.1 peptide chain release factor N(5)-glutamine methyltransferase [Hoeflea sp.]
MRAAFRAADLDTADLDARLLAATIMELEPHQLVTEGDLSLNEAQHQRLAQATWERLNGMPVHRILGAREFYGLRFGLSPATLEPRPDTETLIDAVLPFIRLTVTMKGSCRIVDLGIGTGAIGLALLAECPEAQCLGVDVSAEAVAIALENARSLGLSARYSAVTGDWLSGIEARFDLIVSNPPYIPTTDLTSLSREVIDHDPMLALDGGPDGLSAYRAIAAQAPDRIEEEGLLALEIGTGQKASVAALFVASGFEMAGVIADLGGVDRVLLFKSQDGT